MERNPAKNNNMQAVVGNLLRLGVLLSMAIVLAGGLLYIVGSYGAIANYSVFKTEQSSFTSISSILTGISSLKGDAIIQFGLIVLIFTPIARVLLAVISFFIEKDYLYVGIGLLILAIIAVSFNSGLTH